MFEKLMDRIVVNGHELIFDETDMVRVMTVINQKQKGLVSNKVILKSCGWADSTKWFVRFDVTNANWKDIVEILSVKRVWRTKAIPTEPTGEVYSVD